MKHASLITAALFLLTGCEFFAKPLPGVIPPANLTAPCPPLDSPEETMDLGDLLRYTVETVGLYRECAERHKGLAEIVTSQ